MFQSYALTPVNLKPPTRPSRRMHGVFAGKVEKCCLDLRGEKDVVDSTNGAANELLQTIDAVLSHGLLSNDRCYWRFVKEFLPKTEQVLMENTHSKGSIRRLSFAWLKDSFNKNSIYFQLLAFLDGRAMSKRFYHEAACVRNYGTFELIVFNVGRLENVQFAFDGQGQTANGVVHPMVAEEIEENGKAVVLKSAGEEVADGVKVKDLEPAEEPQISEMIAPTVQPERSIEHLLDQKVMLTDLLRKRKKHLEGLYEQENAAEQDSKKEENVVEEPKEERFNDVLQKTISQCPPRLSLSFVPSEAVSIVQTVMNEVRLESLDTVAKSFDSLLNLNDRPSTSREVAKKKEEKEEKVEGEIALHSGEILRFVMDIFHNLDEGEKFQRIFHVYDGAPSAEKARLLLVTDYNLYLLTQTVTGKEYAKDSRDIEVDYVSHLIMPIANVEYIEVTHGGLILTFYAASGKQFIVGGNGTSNERIVGIVSGDQTLGKIIVETIAAAVISLKQKPPPPIYEVQAPLDLILRRYVSKLNLAASDIRQMFVSFWVETPRSIKDEEQVEPTYLFRREIARGWFGGGQTDWQQNFFVLRESKLYIFTDSSCHDGLRVIDLSKCADTNFEEVSLSEHPHVVTISLDDAVIEISFPTMDEKHKWHMSMQNACCQIPESSLSSSITFITDSHLIVAQLGENAHVDGFIRTLDIFKCELIREILFYKTSNRTIILVGIENVYEWFMLRTEMEVKRFKDHFSEKVPCLDLIDQNDQSNRTAALIEARASRYPHVWGQQVFVTGSDALSDIEDKN